MIGPRRLRVTLVTCALFCVATCLEWGGLLSAAWSGDLSRYQQIADQTFAGGIPYHSFYDEYPPFALPPFLLARAISNLHYDLVFKLLMVACWCLAIYLVVRIMAALSASRGRLRLALGAMVLTPPLLGQVFLNRYDPYAATLALAALAALVVGRNGLASGWLSAGFSAKVFPLAAAPIVAIRIWRRDGVSGLARATGIFALVALSIVGYFLVVAFGGIGYSYYSQVTRGLQIESMGASLLLLADKLSLYTTQWGPAPPGQIDLVGRLPNAIADLSFAVEIVAIGLAAWAYWRGSDDVERLVTAFSASIVAYTIFSKVLSPQYLTWLVPLVALTRSRRATWLMLIALPLTQAEVYWGNHGLRSANWSVWLLVLRNAALVAVFAILYRDLRRADRSDPALAAV